MNIRRTLLAAAVAAPALALLGAAPVQAAPTSQASAGQPTVSVGQLVLDPTERGYRGNLPVTVVNRSKQADSFSVSITEPVGASFRGLVPSGICFPGEPVENRRSWSCPVPGGELAPGARSSFAVDFEVLTTPRLYAMRAGGGTVTLSSGSGNALDQAPFTALFRSTSGSLRNPRPYVQDTTAAASITADPALLTLTRQADGTFAGRLSTSVRYAGDAAHDELSIQAIGLPTGVRLSGTVPASPCFFSSCTVPGGRFMAGEQRFVDILFTADPTTSVGDLGTVQLSVSTRYGANAVTDADPSDNTVDVAVSAAETL